MCSPWPAFPVACSHCCVRLHSFGDHPSSLLSEDRQGDDVQSLLTADSTPPADLHNLSRCLSIAAVLLADQLVQAIRQRHLVSSCAGYTQPLPFFWRPACDLTLVSSSLLPFCCCSGRLCCVVTAHHGPSYCTRFLFLSVAGSKDSFVGSSHGTFTREAVGRARPPRTEHLPCPRPDPAFSRHRSGFRPSAKRAGQHHSASERHQTKPEPPEFVTASRHGLTQLPSSSSKRRIQILSHLVSRFSSHINRPTTR